MFGAREQSSVNGEKSRSTGLGLRESMERFVGLVAGTTRHFQRGVSRHLADFSIPTVIGCAF